MEIKIKSEKLSEFENGLEKIFFEKNLFSIAKTDLIEELLYLSNKCCEVPFLDKDNYTLARDLHTTESKIKTTKQNIAQKFFSDDEYKSLFNNLLEKIVSEKIALNVEPDEKKDGNTLKLTVEDKNERNVLAYMMKQYVKETSDRSFNSEIVVVKKQAFLDTILSYLAENNGDAVTEQNVEKIRKTIKEKGFKLFLSDVLSFTKENWIDLAGFALKLLNGS